MGNARLGRSNWEIFLRSPNVYMQINGFADVAAVQFVWEVLRKRINLGEQACSRLWDNNKAASISKVLSTSNLEVM